MNYIEVYKAFEYQETYKNEISEEVFRRCYIKVPLGKKEDYLKWVNTKTNYTVLLLGMEVIKSNTDFYTLTDGTKVPTAKIKPINLTIKERN